MAEGRGTKIAAWAGLAGALAAITPQVGEYIKASAELKEVQAEQIAKALARESKTNDKAYEELVEVLDAHANEIEFLKGLVSDLESDLLAISSSDEEYQPAVTTREIMVERVDGPPLAVTAVPTPTVSDTPKRKLHPRKKRSDYMVGDDEVQQAAESLF